MVRKRESCSVEHAANRKPVVTPTARAWRTYRQWCGFLLESAIQERSAMSPYVASPGAPSLFRVPSGRGKGPGQPGFRFVSPPPTGCNGRRAGPGGVAVAFAFAAGVGSPVPGDGSAYGSVQRATAFLGNLRELTAGPGCLRFDFVVKDPDPRRHEDTLSAPIPIGARQRRDGAGASRRTNAELIHDENRNLSHVWVVRCPHLRRGDDRGV